VVFIEPFKKLREEKQTHILNVAMEEFAEKGYDQASTNQIVKQAGIGKGMLFYYFKTKQDLYYYLIDYAIDFIESNYMNHIDDQESDFIERLRRATLLKMKTYQAHPNIFHFLGSIFMNENIDLPVKLQQKYEQVHRRGSSLLFDHIDTTLFRKDIDVEKAIDLIRWSIEGYQHHIIRQLQGKNLATIDFDPLWEEFFAYLDVLKTVYYE